MPPSSATISVTPAHKLRSIDILPPPFAWIDIPAGKVVIDSETKTVAPFQIAKYPITNAQFAKFVEADGYNQLKWLTEVGWKQREGWTQPRYWDNSNLNKDDQPVVGVSWYEAVAFCLWLSAATDESIMIPTEVQWQYAAQGDEGRAYPWGNNWDGSRCNNNVNGQGIRRTSPVREYEGKGESPFGVVDMAGNVWEWCLTDYETRTNDIYSNANKRVLRGGSWFEGNISDFQVRRRFWYNPRVWDGNYGFRIARSR
jgi:formylglycine-generating enzyme required for sulfatase activity